MIQSLYSEWNTHTEERGINTWETRLERIHTHLTPSHCDPSQAVFSSLWTSKVTRSKCSHNGRNECRQNDQQLQCVSNPIRSGMNTCKQPKSNMSFDTVAWLDACITSKAQDTWEKVCDCRWLRWYGWSFHFKRSSGRSVLPGSWVSSDSARLQVVAAVKEKGRATRTPPPSPPLCDLNCFNQWPHVDPDKRPRSESPSALLLQGEPSRLGASSRLSRSSTSPQQASALFALEIVLSQVTVKVAGFRRDLL